MLKVKVMLLGQSYPSFSIAPKVCLQHADIIESSIGCLLETTAPQYLEEGSCQLISMPFILLIFLPFTLLPPLSLKEMATHSSILAWEILRTEKPGRLQSMRLQRVGHDLVTRKQQLLSPDTPTGSPSGGPPYCICLLSQLTPKTIQFLAQINPPNSHSSPSLSPSTPSMRFQNPLYS